MVMVTLQGKGADGEAADRVREGGGWYAKQAGEINYAHHSPSNLYLLECLLYSIALKLWLVNINSARSAALNCLLFNTISNFHNVFE